MNILGSANIIRNTLQLKQMRIGKVIGMEDPLEDIVVATLADANVQSRSRTNYEFKGVRGDIDVLAIFDGVLFIMECKGSLHPCNTFELRASFDLLRDAERQLDRISPLLHDSAFLAYLEEKLCLRLCPVRKVACAIVMGNRMFAGWRAGKYPVRSLLDLTTFVNSGVTGVAGQRAHLRQEGPITVEALSSYIDSDLAYARIFDAMEPFEREASIGGKSVVLRSFQLNWVTLASNDSEAARRWISENEHLVLRKNGEREW
jgi:hypothetical protein